MDLKNLNLAETLSNIKSLCFSRYWIFGCWCWCYLRTNKVILHCLCILRMNDTVKLPCCQARKAWGSLAISAFLSFKFTFYFCKFFTVWLFLSESSFPIFPKIWCSLPQKLDTLRSEDLTLKMADLNNYLRENFDNKSQKGENFKDFRQNNFIFTWPNTHTHTQILKIQPQKKLFNYLWWKKCKICQFSMK